MATLIRGNILPRADDYGNRVSGNGVFLVYDHDVPLHYSRGCVFDWETKEQYDLRQGRLRYRCALLDCTQSFWCFALRFFGGNPQLYGRFIRNRFGLYYDGVEYYFPYLRKRFRRRGAAQMYFDVA